MGLSARDQKLLWGRARDLCSFGSCRQPLTADQVDTATGETFATVIGEEAHIRSASPDGPRYDPGYPAEKLETYENRILLCPVHHTLIDDGHGRAYDAAALEEMKKRHETLETRRERLAGVVRAYLADQFDADDRVRFRQVKLDGPTVDSMFVDVPFACRDDAVAAGFLRGVAAWTADELWAVKNRPGAPRRRRGITSQHGTRSRSGSGCRCDRCQAASAASQREWERRQAEKRLPPNIRAELITRLRRGELLAPAARALHITANQIWGRARRDIEWAELLQTTLDQARPSDLGHGVQSGFDRGCRCTECREAIRRASRNRRTKRNTTPHRLGLVYTELGRTPTAV